MKKNKVVLFALPAGFVVMMAVLGISLTVRAQAKAEANKAEPQAGEVWREPVTGMEFVWIPAGEFMMGSSGGEANEQPIHKVHLDGFWMGKYEVTQGQWKALMYDNPAKFKNGDNYPVEQINWGDTLDFIVELNKRSKDHFRLPTEAEWEYACRAGTPGQRYGELRDIAWFNENSKGHTHPVGQKKPNAWGLHDMLGNVWEWCQDWYAENYYATSPLENPGGPSSSFFRAFRGGSWQGIPQRIRSACRFGGGPSSRVDILGFRLARTK
jgi:formylglycine-generating enzyme required for sulfatase activity